jgi:regulation of enolase protein 1 (concanavalin A-like superfamily)
MKKRVSKFSLILLTVLLGNVTMHGGEEKNPFAGESLPNEWTWKHPNPEAWHLRGGGLEIKIEPGNMWGEKNDAKNVLLIPIADNLRESGTDVQVTLANSPTRRWEQVDLVWYYRDSHMVKIGLELEHGKNSVVMGREEYDRTRTIKIVPIEKDEITVRLKITGGQVRGYYRLAPGNKWVKVGACTEPKPTESNDEPRVSLQCYQGDPQNPHWARITGLKIDSIIETRTERDYSFDGKISRTVLENYLSRAITFAELLNNERVQKQLGGNTEDNIRMLTNVGAKFVGRAIYMWGSESRLDGLLARARPIVKKIHSADPDIVLQAAAFEIVSQQVETLKVPEWVFDEFDLDFKERNFDYEAMLYPNGHRVNHWRIGSSVPDMSRLETRMWFFYLAARYIDIGIEAIHFGQVEIMDDRDPNHIAWRDMMVRVRHYAAKHARGHFLLADAHVPSGGIVNGDRLLFDFHSFPLRIDEVVTEPQKGVLKVGYLDSIFKRSKGGISPSGWRCDSLPYIVELDNFGSSGKPGQNIGMHYIWGYDEICWFAHQPADYRNFWLRYAWEWIRQHDLNGYLQMPGSRTLANPVGNKIWYWANTPSKAVPAGFGQEETIKAIWAEDE